MQATDEYFQHISVNRHAKMFSGLSDEKRVKILLLLTLREMCNCELTAATKSSQPNLTYHIKILENAGLVTHRRQGKFIYYALTQDETTRQIINMLTEAAE